MKTTMINPTTNEVFQAIVTGLAEANHGAKVRTLSPAGFTTNLPALLAMAAYAAIDHAEDGGGVCNSYRGAASTTAIRLVAVTYKGDRHVQVETGRHYAKRGAYGGTTTITLGYTCPSRLRCDIGTRALVALELIETPNEYAVRGMVKGLRETAKASGKMFADRWINTGAAYLLDSDLYAVERSAGLVRRYGYLDGKIVPVGVAVKLPHPTETGTYWEHGDTIKMCHAERAAKVAACSARSTIARAARLIVRLCPNLQVSYSDARSVGYCAAGIDSWCQAHGINPDAGSVPAAQLRGDVRSEKVVLAVANRIATERFATT